MSLGDSFPKKILVDRVNSLLTVGSVFKFFLDDMNPPKTKRLVLVGEYYNEYYFVIINSNKNTKVNYSLYLQSLHLELNPEGREYLDKTSYVDCSQLRSYDKSYVFKVVFDRIRSHIGVMNENDINNVLHLLIKAETIKGKVKKRIGLFK